MSFSDRRRDDGDGREVEGEYIPCGQLVQSFGGEKDLTTSAKDIQ